mmetsp:Transcript_38618/g.27944  ORF Transcript_38618/g.27944 Transcript_38618/m.27944 type:complete len:161 (-) Transcript_38618:2318-2800(-)
MFKLPANIKENPYEQLVDLTKYDMTTINKEVKDILFRPQQVRNLYKQYWKLASEQEKKQFEVIKEKERVKYDPRYPPKRKSETEIFHKVVKVIKEAIAEDEQSILRRQKEHMNLEILKDEACKDTKNLFYQGCFKEAIAERKKIPRDVRKAEKAKGDEID